MNNELLQEDPFFSLPFSEQLRQIDQLLAKEVLPVLHQDHGGVQMMGLDGHTLYLHYTGACSGCAYATTSTLKFIREKLHQQLSPLIEIELA